MALPKTRISLRNCEFMTAHSQRGVQVIPTGPDCPPAPTTLWRLASGWKTLSGILVLIALPCGGLWIHHTFLSSNFHVVIPSKVYRSAQLQPDALARVVQEYSLRSVINLRGCCPGFDWYEQERQVLERLNVRQYDIRLSYKAPPPAPELRKLIHVLLECEKPALLHCRRGADRTGLASALALLLEGQTLKIARREFSLRYGWFAMGGPERLVKVLDWYEDWLAKTNTTSSKETLIAWVSQHYKPGHLWAEIEPLAVPQRWQVGQAAAGRFRVYNRSDFSWEFRISPRRGVHLRAWLLPKDIAISDPAQLDGLPTDAAGFFDVTVPPGGSLELTLPLPRSDQAGRFLLLVDLVDACDGPFGIYGSPTFRRWIAIE